MRILYFLISVVLCCLFCAGCSRIPADTELRRLDSETKSAMARFADSGIDSLGALLLDEAVAADNALYQGKAHFYLSYFKRGLDSATVRAKLGHLDRAEAIALETGNDTLLAYVYNQRGVWEMGQNLAPVTARYWFNKSIETATPLGERRISIPAEVNMLEACRLTGDTLGIRYGRDLFDYAAQSGLPELRFSTGLHCGLYTARTASDTTALEPYVQAIESLPGMAEGMRDMLYATFFYHRGDYEAAARHMEQAGPLRYNDFIVFYADILSRLGRYGESDTWLDRTGAETGCILFPNLKETVQRLRAQNAAAEHDWQRAYAAQRKYEAMRDSAERLNTRDLSKRYNIEYEVNIKDRQIALQKQRLKELKIRFSWAAACVLLLIAAYAVYHMKRRRFYRDIVRQNIDFIERQKDYEQRLLCDSQNAASAESTAPKLNESRIDEIFERIRVLAEEKQVWRDVSISRDSFADMAGCNRTYFTEAIKARTGMSYTQYMNSFRIREAIKILSDMTDTTPLKDLATQLGFLTVANFYTAFKKETGMSPAAFRKTAHKLRTDARADDGGN